jgi:hypothetical protein
MSRFRHRDDESSSTAIVVGALVGAVAGFAAGMLVAQRVGGFSGLKSKLRRRRGTAEEPRVGAHGVAEDEDEFEDVEEDEVEGEGYDETLEERVLEAFRNDPILCERAIDIGSLNDGVIELAGWVEDDGESRHAVTEARWEGRQVGTGRRRQGTSAEMDRHADPKPELEDRWQDTDDAIRNAADDTTGIAERRTRAKRAVRGDRAGGSAVAPSGVPKGDHVANPLEVDRSVARVEPTDETGGRQVDSGDRY